ncbi:UDP-N-acetylmuramoyl-L-alanyl-D-glutamate--2,6-diaminopimelate ligase [Uliginosibacterium sp. H3]|uniref:UDP-N-acetylmuramoyl-L-alanyl-D-glutamate--2,6-diaminopimelate ligase n=1 Tax=Uliginosibacterium silvisoli TaxID=3114758 RepID=A0ABU6K310_9RHOO|nr:UDP-N-acetylmuramoyl-L-alanyl-D-glutamate--2,6-diaminopimelate ligase [Uliginosibacterium sp. H3]
MTTPLAAALLALLRAEGIAPNRVCADSRRVQPGDIFLAYPGHASDGRMFIGDAIAKGAAAVVWEREGFEWSEQFAVPNVPVDQLRWLAGDIADEVFGHPSESLWTVGITGTNGKTSVSQWLARAFTDLGKRCAVIGTLGIGFPGRLDPSANTTPDSIVLHEQLARLKGEGAEAVAMEVSSIGLDQGRINGCRLDIAVFTNLTRDHLDYHRTMDAYAAAKAQLFDQTGLRAAVLNFDDIMGVAQARRLEATAVEVVGYTLIPDNIDASAAKHVLVAEQLRNTPSGMRFVVVCGAQRAELNVGLVGQFNVSNLLAVIAVLVESGFSFEQAVDAARRLTPPEGRMQTLGGIGEPMVVVDYAHTPDALEQAILALRPTANSRGGHVICVFGCGGDRDPGKRPMMGEVAERLAHQVIITSDNPRGESPDSILDDIARGAPKAQRVTDRAAAIRAALTLAQDDDIVLIAGKGHETYQEIAGRREHFSDAEQARAALKVWTQNRTAGHGGGGHGA